MRRSIGIHFRTSPFSSLYQRFQFASDLLDPIMFADNTNLLNSNKDINTVFHRVNDELQKINVWFISNKLSLNMKKKTNTRFTTNLTEKMNTSKTRFQKISVYRLKQGYS